MSFFYVIFTKYLSENNKKNIYLNRNNIDRSHLENSNNLPFFKNDTSNVIEFNSGYTSNDKNKKRKFWQLLNNK